MKEESDPGAEPCSFQNI